MGWMSIFVYLLEQWTDSSGTVRLSQGQSLWDSGWRLWLYGAKPLGGHRKPLSLLESKGS